VRLLHARCNGVIGNPITSAVPLQLSFFDAGLKERKTNEKKALEELRANWEKFFKVFKDNLTTEI